LNWWTYQARAISRPTSCGQRVLAIDRQRVGSAALRRYARRTRRALVIGFGASRRDKLSGTGGACWSYPGNSRFGAPCAVAAHAVTPFARLLP
jgi:hypothetical protein